jgi:hypothetical protein
LAGRAERARRIRERYMPRGIPTINLLRKPKFTTPPGVGDWNFPSFAHAAKSLG